MGNIFDDLVEKKPNNEKKDMLLLKEGDNKIDLNAINDIEDKEFEFDNSDGTKRKVIRYFYKFNTDSGVISLLIPFSVHNDIITIRRKTKTNFVNVVKTGSGKKTKYQVYPV